MSIAEARSMAWLVIEHLLESEKVIILANPDWQWTNKQIVEIEQLIEQLKKSVPIQYLLGRTNFHGLELLVEPGVLIPRGETEELVEWVIREVNEKYSAKQVISVLDIGCGSGAIGIALAKHCPLAEIHCVDWYEKPLAMTRKNADLNEVNISVESFNALDPNPEWYNRSFDIIVSNPPYVTPAQQNEMGKNVVDHEPREALFVSEHDPLQFYRHIAQYAKEVLNTGGALFFEINETYGQPMVDLLKTQFSQVTLRQDIHAKDRMLKACQHG